MSVLADRRYRFTVEQYHRMAAGGILDPDCRVELLDGEIFEMTPVDPRHAGIVDWLGNRFATALGDRAIVRVQNPTRLDPRSEPQPDVMLLRARRDFYRSAHPTPEDTFLLVEVAHTSLRHDRGRKLPLYARTGVREVWIVNLQADVVEVYRTPSADGYRDHDLVRRGQHIAPAAFPDCRLSLDNLLG